ncbi:ShlB/FhaC/HecB family hemolysin secretion/activation protein [Pantoea agglomerans]|uniref:ShlB/FhaC/HecB family hemolysin secretion/activation protein n=1 Tax=Enterobacter agglomerans TaxID=549 RepID=UPI001302771A|nr:ShlB/FhaC/HecB family hemolysin secretion/activation protein [Pantoea agglomerans]NEG86408.1 ShlB/FhaC/HecB family hemolysin secretion/activation protein [Pantoea agglomerans]NEH08355.1 ShlB/FhaC/HecB family hemolysin secretion/activation protein [Pantoea agglomerans]NQS80636.1 ShlB/FhaC/HecB family hemolysin secretion/activation protein [Pantoea agglomerans]QGY57747.1 ShlB/FhaC/HecB family hemolysin secretion/activation protein [Pantoea agglomerans]UEG75841.1 ShlB/FhaC/HecB family hemolysi
MKMPETGKWLVFGASLFISNVMAAPVTPGDLDVIQNQQQQRLQQDQQQRDALTQAHQVELQKTESAPASGPCFEINQISLQQASLITPDTQKRLVAPYINQCLSLDRINQLVRAISEWYVQRGYITSRAFLTEQNLSHGTLNITVLEGKLEAIHLQGASARQLNMAFPTRAGRILNLRDIEQGMEQINRLRTTPVQIEIIPSSQPGYSIVNLTSTPEFPLTLGLNMDNSGQRSTGIGQLSGSLVGNDLLGVADRWFVSGGRSSAFSDWRDAQNFQAGVSVPYGYGLLDYSYSWSNYHSRFNANSFDWYSNGDNISNRLSGSWVLFRNGQIKTGLQVGLNHYVSHNWLNETLLQSSSRKLTSLQIGFNHTQKIAGGVATLNPMLSRGMPWFDAESDKGKSDDFPKAEFRKWSVSSSYQRPVTQKMWWLSSFYAQWSPDRLYGSERLTIGGENSVRGYKEQYLSGDVGGYLRNELNYSLFTLPAIGEVSTTLALDGGWLQSDKQDRYAAGTLWGSSLGLGTRNAHVSTQLSLGIPVSYPNYLAPDRLSVYARVGLVF